MHRDRGDAFSKIELPEGMTSEMLHKALIAIESVQMRPGTSDADLAIALFMVFKG